MGFINQLIPIPIPVFWGFQMTPSHGWKGDGAATATPTLNWSNRNRLHGLAHNCDSVETPWKSFGGFHGMPCQKPRVVNPQNY